MAADFQLPTDPGARRYRRTLAGGVAASVLLHAAAVIVLGSGSGVPRAGELAEAGGATRSHFRGMEAVSVRTAESSSPARSPAQPEISPARSPAQPQIRRPSERERPVRRLPRLRRPAPVQTGRPVAVEMPRLALAPAGGPGGEGTREARPGMAGRDPAAGRDGSAGGGSATPAVPRTLLPEWSPPNSVRGSRVTVRVEVDADGRPTGRVELLPPTPSESFNRTLRQRMTSVRYLPQRHGGEPVKGWAEITYVF